MSLKSIWKKSWYHFCQIFQGFKSFLNIIAKMVGKGWFLPGLYLMMHSEFTLIRYFEKLLFDQINNRLSTDEWLDGSACIWFDEFFFLEIYENGNSGNHTQPFISVSSGIVIRYRYLSVINWVYVVNKKSVVTIKILLDNSSSFLVWMKLRFFSKIRFQKCVKFIKFLAALFFWFIFVFR